MSQFESQFEEKLYNERREKLLRIAALGQKAGLTPAEAVYPNHFHFSPPDIDVPTIKREYANATAEQLEAETPRIAIAGRLIAIRLQGKAGFAQLQQAGESLQIYVRKDNVGDDGFELYKLLDLGDHVGVEGILFRTRTNELTLQVQKLTFLSKAMLPLPDKFSGLGDIELRYRRRYLDLFTDTGDTPDSEPTTTLSSRPEREARSGETPVSSSQAVAATRLPAREVFEKRAKVLRALRKFFDARGYLEVETPMLQTIAGGAAARPFTTHHNALDIPLSLRIAPELYLKRLVVGGFDRVYEINRNFRNEGVSTQHNPEFTMLEFYQAYANYHDLMELTPELIEFLALEVNGTASTSFNLETIELSARNWTKLSMREAVAKWWPLEAGRPPELKDFESPFSFGSFLAIALERFLRVVDRGDGVETRRPDVMVNNPNFNSPFHLLLDRHLKAVFAEQGSYASVGKAVTEIFEFLAEPHLIQPTIIYDFPLAVSPLSKQKPGELDWVERFEFYIGGFEVGNAFSELNDPEDQRNRFLDQLKERDRGDDEAHAMDEDYVRALGYGLPPTAGEGIGIDRLTMILTGSRSIRDVILFPLMRPHKTVAAQEEEHTHGESAE